MDKADNRFVLLGIDSATLRIIKPLVDKKRLPAMARMISEGIHGNLQSAVPMLSPSLWTTISTGRNPGAHGIYDFLYLNSKNQIVYNSSLNRKVPPIWKTLSRMNKTVCVSGLMMTYPADTVNGCMTATILNDPNPQKNSPGGPGTYPLELEKEIDESIGRIKFTPSKQLDIQTTSDTILKWIEHRKKLYRYLSSKDKYDFRFFFFPETDHIAHMAWALFEQNDPMGCECIYRTYESIDRYIAELMDEPATNVMIVSDHGSRILRRVVSINNILARSGYLKYGHTHKTMHLVRRIKNTIHNTIFTGNRHPYIPGIDEMATVIKWKDTRAYSIGTTAGNIYINLKNRNYSGIVEPSDYKKLRNEIAELLLKTEDPQNHQRIVDKVYMKEDLFKGDALEKAPDMCATFRDGYGVKVSSKDIVTPDTIIRDNEDWFGEHDVNGVIMAHGPGFTKGAQPEKASIIDVAPTVFAALGVPVPNDMDGRVLAEILNTKHKISTQGSGSENSTDRPQKKIYDREEEKSIEERLKNLGYM